MEVGKEVPSTGGPACAKALHPSWLAIVPHLVGCHQVQVARIHGIKLHDVVHGLPIGHSQHPPAYYLHALVQADLWKKRPSSTGARDCHPQGQAAPGLGVSSPVLLRWSRVKGEAGLLDAMRVCHTLVLTDSSAPPPAPGTKSLLESNTAPRYVWAVVSQTTLWEAAGCHG